MPDIIYIDDTFVRTYGSKRIAMPRIIEYIRNLKRDGAELYCWSSGGADYARSSAEEFGIEDCFNAFLPKPTIIVDDQRICDWRGLVERPPNECSVDE
jgi:hypothetical protein